MIVKTVEIRDNATCISALAIKMVASDPIEAFHLDRSGFGADYPLVILMTLDPVKATYDPYSWGHTRTLTTAHRYIQEHFDQMLQGHVIDVSYILGERPEPRKTERIH